jgi:hypothetical protein
MRRGGGITTSGQPTRRTTHPQGPNTQPRYRDRYSTAVESTEAGAYQWRAMCSGRRDGNVEGDDPSKAGWLGLGGEAMDDLIMAPSAVQWASPTG